VARERIAALFYARRFEIARSAHAIERCRRLGAAAFGYATKGTPRFDLAATEAPAVRPAGPYAVLLVNASRATKLWPEACWIELERWLAARGLVSVLFWGSADEEARTRSLAMRMQQAVVAPRSPIGPIAATLAQARLVVGLDTGLSHLAAALGRPTVALYADYDPALVGVVGDGPVASLGGVDRPPATSEVIEAAERLLDLSQ
jgi:heptosyltransferase-1